MLFISLTLKSLSTSSRLKKDMDGRLLIRLMFLTEQLLCQQTGEITYKTDITGFSSLNSAQWILDGAEGELIW